MSKPSPKPFRPKSGKLFSEQEPAPEPKRKFNQKWYFLIGAVLGVFYLVFIVYGARPPT